MAPQARQAKATWPHLVVTRVSRGRSTRTKRTPSGHYVGINVSARDLALRCRRLLEALGHRESDIEYIYE